MNLPFRSVLTVLALSTSAYLLFSAGRVGAQEEGRVMLGQAPSEGTPHVIGTPYDESGSAKIGSDSTSETYIEEGAAVIGGHSGAARVGGGSSSMQSANIYGGDGSASASVNVPQRWYAPPSSVDTNTFPGIQYRVLDDPFKYKLRLDKRVGGLQGYANGYTNLGAFLPFGDGENSLWFADVRAMITDNGKAGANIGFGHRYYMEELDAVQGFSFWWDYDDGHQADAYNQIGLSYSMYSRYWRINANGYIVTNDNQQTVNTYITGNPFYVNSNIGINRLYNNETAYSGGDVEIGGPLPIFGRYGVDAYIGAYGLTANGGEDAIGVKARFEAQINEDLTITGTATQDRVFDNNYQLGILYTFPNKSYVPSRWFRQRKVYEAMALGDRRNYRVSVNQTQDIQSELLINPVDNLPFQVAHIIPPEGVGQGVTPGGSGTIEDPFVSLISYDQIAEATRQQYDIIMVSQPNADDPGVNLTSGITIFQNQRLLSNSGLTNLITSTVGTFALPDTGYGFGVTPILTNAFEDADNDGVLDPTEDIDANGLLSRGEDRNGNGVLDAGEDVNGNGNLDLWTSVVTIDATDSKQVAQDALTEVRGFIIDGSNAGTEFVGGELNTGISTHMDPNGNGILDDTERLLGFSITNNTIREVNYGINLATKGTLHEDVDFDGKLDLVNEDIDGDGKLDVNEDANGNGMLDVGEDLDGDGVLDVNEDVDGDGKIDIVEDLNGNGTLDIGTEGIIENNTIIGANFQSNRGILLNHSGESLLLRVANNMVGGFRGEDVDGDGNLDVNEDTNGNGFLDPGEDLDGDLNLDVAEDNNGDGILDNGIGIEIINTANGGRANIFANNLAGTNANYIPYGIVNNITWLSEDVDGDGNIDVDEDTNNNGILDTGEDVDGDNHLDVAEDLNGNGVLELISNGSGLRMVTTNTTAHDAGFFVDLFGNDLSNSRDEVGAGMSVLSSGTQANFEFDLFMNNAFNNNLGDGALIVADDPGTVRFNSIISGNEFIGNGKFVDDTNNDGDVTDILDVNLTNSRDLDNDLALGGDGLRIVSTGAGSQVFIAGIGDTSSAISNRFEDNLDDGLQIDATDSIISSEIGADNIVYIFNNGFTGNGDDGMFVNLDNSQAIISFGLESDATLGNTFSNNGLETDVGNGLTLYGQNGSVISGGVYGNTFTSNAANGLYIGLENSSLGANYEIISNTATFNGLDGVQLNMNASTSTGLVLALNDASGNGRNGINFLMEDSTLTDYLIMGNNMNNNGNTALPGPGAFNIDFVFISGLTAAQQAMVESIGSRWEEIIIGDLPDVDLGGGNIIDDFQIEITAEDLGDNGILGFAGPTGVRNGSFLPYLGQMTLNTFYFDDQENLEETILHEMAHAMGFGTVWTDLNLLQNPSNGDGITDVRYTGTTATAEYNAIFGNTDPSVPVENFGAGSADAHWRESVLTTELMSPSANAGFEPISRITVGQFQDLGYVVDMNAADVYLPPRSAATSYNRTLGDDLAPTTVTVSNATANFYISPLLVSDPGSTGNGLHMSQINGTANGIITQNTIDANAEYGVSINLEGTALNTITEFSRNTITNNGMGGINVVTADQSFFRVNNFSGNDVSDNLGIGFHVVTDDTSGVDLNITGPLMNNFDGNTDAGIGLEFGGDSGTSLARPNTVDISNISITNTTNGADPDFFGDGIAIITNNNAIVDSVQIGQNGTPSTINTVIDGNAGNGIQISTNSQSSIDDLDIENVALTNNGQDGIQISSGGVADLGDVLIDHNLIDDNNANGMDIDLFANDSLAAVLNFVITNNEITDNAQNGIDYLASGSTNSDIRIGSTIVGGGDPLVLEDGENVITGNGVDGINMIVESLAQTDAIIRGNLITGTGSSSHGIDILTRRGLPNFNPISMDIDIEGNYVSENGINGLNLGSTVNEATFGDANPDLLATVTNNYFVDNGLNGIGLFIDGRAEVIVDELSDNIVQGNEQDGLNITTNGALDPLFVVNNNTLTITNAQNNSFSLNGRDGVFINTLNPLGNAATGTITSTGTVTANFLDNEISSNDRNGFYILNTLNNDVNVTIGETVVGASRINDNGANGLRVENNAGALLTDNDINITVTDTDIVGNGRNTTLTDEERIGLYLLVGTSGGTPVFDVTDPEGVLLQSAGGDMQADIRANYIVGSGYLDVVVESFVATPDPPVLSPGQFILDPKARLGLNLEGNVGGSIDVTRFGAYYDNADQFKSNPMIYEDDIANSAGTSRRRNAQRNDANFLDYLFDIVDSDPAPTQNAGAGTTTFEVDPNQPAAAIAYPQAFVGLFGEVNFLTGAVAGQERAIVSYNNGVYVITAAGITGGEQFTVDLFNISGIGESTFRTTQTAVNINNNFTNVISDFTDAIELGPQAGVGSADPFLTPTNPTFTWETGEPVFPIPFP